MIALGGNDEIGLTIDDILEEGVIQYIIELYFIVNAAKFRVRTVKLDACRTYCIPSLCPHNRLLTEIHFVEVTRKPDALFECPHTCYRKRNKIARGKVCTSRRPRKLFDMITLQRFHEFVDSILRESQSHSSPIAEKPRESPPSVVDKQRAGEAWQASVIQKRSCNPTARVAASMQQ